MQPPDDDFPYTSDDPSLAQSEANNAMLSMSSQQLDDLKATLRLMVGSTLVGGDVYIQRLRRAQAMIDAARTESILLDEHETDLDQLRYLLLGLLFETPDLIQRILVRIEKTSAKVFGFFDTIASPIANSRVFKPVRNQVDIATARGEGVIDRLARKGRIEERNSRLIVQQEAIDDLVNELLEYVILKTEAMQIIQEGGTSIAGSAIDVFRDQSSAVDASLENNIKSIFGRRKPSQPDTIPSNISEGG